MHLDLSQLRELLADIDKTSISELTLKSGEFELTVRKEVTVAPSTSVDALLTGGTGSVELASPTVTTSSNHKPETRPITPTAPVASAPTPAPPIESRWVEVTSPMVGTFYRSPAPDEPPFVETGDRIAVGQTVCIIEAMKLMNEIEAEVSGQVMEILVKNGSPVEYGQPLLRINPD